MVGLILTALVGLATLVCLMDPIWGICAYIAVIIFRPNELFEGVLLPAVPVMMIMMSLAYALHMGRITPRSPEAPSHKSPPLMAAMVVLLILHFIVFPSGIPFKSWFLGEFVPIILLLLYMTRHVTTRTRLHAALTTTSLGAAFISLNSLYVHFMLKGPKEQAESPNGMIYEGHGTEWNNYHLYGLRLMGNESTVWGNPNDLGMVTNWGILGCLYYIKRKGSKILKIIAAAVAAGLAGTLFLTGSRGGQLQLGVNLWMVFVGGKRKALGIVLLVIALAGALVVLPRLSPERTDGGESKSERTELLRAGFRLFKAYPIQGCGYMNFPEDNDFKSLLPHNVYVQALAETGLVGSSIFFAMVFFIRRETKAAVKYFGGRDDVNMAVLAQCIGALQLSYSIFILFSNQFMTYRFGLIMTLAMALFRTMANQMRLEELKAGVDEASGADDGAGSDEAPREAAETIKDVVLVDDVPHRGRGRRPRRGVTSGEVAPIRPRPTDEVETLVRSPEEASALLEEAGYGPGDLNRTGPPRPARPTVAALAGESSFKRELRQAYDARDHQTLGRLGEQLLTAPTASRDALSRGCMAMALRAKITGPRDQADAYFVLANILASKGDRSRLDSALAVLEASGEELGWTAADKIREQMTFAGR